jgi:uncharacterized damage-inducible protein DinB
MEPAAAPGSTPPRIDPLERVRETRARTLELVAGLTQEQMDSAPGEGRWSAGEVLDHLVLTDRVYVRDVGELLAMAAAGRGTRLRRTFADLNPSILFLPRSLLPVFELPLTVMSRLLPVGLRDALASSRWLPAHHPDQTAPRPGRPADDLRRDLAAGPDRIAALLAAHPDRDLDALTHSHPLLGVHTLPQLLGFLAGHETRHQGQLRDVLRPARLPA